MCYLSSYLIHNTCIITIITLRAWKLLVLALHSILSYILSIGLYHSPCVVTVHVICKLINICIQLSAACMPLRRHLCMLVTLLDTI